MARMSINADRWPIPDLLKEPQPRVFAHDIDWKKIVREASRDDLLRYLQSIRLETLRLFLALDDREYAIRVIEMYNPEHVKSPQTFIDRAYDLIVWLGQRLP